MSDGTIEQRLELAIWALSGEGRLGLSSQAIIYALVADVPHTGFRPLDDGDARGTINTYFKLPGWALPSARLMVIAGIIGVPDRCFYRENRQSMLAEMGAS